MSKIYSKKIKLDAIILSTTFNEEINDIIKFIKHLLKSSKKIIKSYKVLPVIIFERKEKSKFEYIDNYFKNSYVGIKPILLLNKESRGFSSCLNYGIKNSSSNFIFRIDTDDKLMPYRLKFQLNEMVKNNLDICSGYMKNEKGKLLKYPNSLKSMIMMTALGTNPIAHPSICIRRNIIENYYNENLQRCEDFEIWLRLFLTRPIKFKCLKKPLTIYNEERSELKNSENAFFQIKIRLRYLFKISILGIALFLGIFPNILRLIIPRKTILRLRRRI